MTGAELEPLTTSVVVPLTGEYVELDKPAEVAAALEGVRRLKRDLEDVRRVLEDALRYESERAGSRTLKLGELEATVSGGSKVVYDEVELAQRLRAVGLPEARLAELVLETVSYKVDARVAKSVAASNPRYAEAIEASRLTVPAPVRVSIKQRGATR